MMNLSTIDLERNLELFLSTAFRSLKWEYILFTISIGMALLILPMFMIRIIGKWERKQAQEKGKLPRVYLFPPTAKRKFHFTVIFAMPILALHRLLRSFMLTSAYEIYNVNVIFLAGFLLFVALWAAIGLFRFRSHGLFLTGVFMVGYAAYKQFLWLQYADSAVKLAEGEEVFVRYSAYIISDYLIKASMLQNLTMLVIAIVLTVYYYRRRFLFTPNRLDMPTCIKCGKPINKGDNFCTCCGNKLQLNPIRLKVISLDEAIYCKKCGKNIQIKGCCKCEGVEQLEKHFRNIKYDKAKEWLYKLIILAIVILAIFLPAWIDRVNYLSRDKADVSDAYVERYIEFYERPDVACDAEWLAGFDSDSNALYAIDSRWKNIRLEEINSNNLAYYCFYAEASFKQMKVMEAIRELVHSVANGTVDQGTFQTKRAGLANDFDNTLVQQSEANAYARNLLSDRDLFDNVETYFAGGIRYYLGGIDTEGYSVALIAASILMLMYLLNSFSCVTITWAERWCQNCRRKTDGRITGRNEVFLEEGPTTTLNRIISSLKECGDSILRFMSELWLLVVRLICFVLLFLSLFGPGNVGQYIRWIKNGLTGGTKKHDTNSPKKYRKKKWITDDIQCILFGYFFSLFLLGCRDSRQMKMG